MIGKLIKEEMKRRGITQHSMSEKTGIWEGGLSTILNDKGNPTADTIERIVDALDYKLVIIPKDASCKDS